MVALRFDKDSLSRLLRRPAVISTKNALLWGLFWLLGGAIIGWHYSIVSISLFEYTWGIALLLRHVAYGLVLWLSYAILYYIAALLINRRVSIVELWGRVLYAHWPVTLLMLPCAFGDKIAYSTFMVNKLASFELSPIYATLMLLYVVLIFVWYIYWGYCAFSCAVQRSGKHVVAIYGVIFVLSYMLSRVILSWIVV